MQSTTAFPLRHLPPVWAGWIETTATRLNTPQDYAASGLFAALTAVAGPRVVAEPVPGWQEPLELWLCQVGGPLSGRSRALDAAGALLTGVALARQDELARWLARKSNHEAGSVVGALRPSELGGAFAGHIGEATCSRFLYFWPERPGWRSLVAPPSTVVLSDMPPGASGVPSLDRLATLAPDPAQKLVLPFTSEALVEFDDFCARNHEEIGDADTRPLAWLARARSVVVRLAASLALLDWLADGAADPPDAIDVGSLKRAIALFEEYFRPQAMRVLERGNEAHRLAPVDRVLRWLRATGVDSVSKDEVRRQGLSESLDAAGTAGVIAELEARGILVLLPRPIGKEGRPSDRWSVHLDGREFSETRKPEERPPARPIRGVPLPFDLPEIKGTPDLLPALSAVGRATAEGKLTVGECRSMGKFVESHLQVIAATEFEQRLVVVEGAAKEMKGVREALESLRSP